MGILGLDSSITGYIICFSIEGIPASQNKEGKWGCWGSFFHQGYIICWSIQRIPSSQNKEGERDAGGWFFHHWIYHMHWRHSCRSKQGREKGMLRVDSSVTGYIICFSIEGIPASQNKEGKWGCRGLILLSMDILYVGALKAFLPLKTRKGKGDAGGWFFHQGWVDATLTTSCSSINDQSKAIKLDIHLKTSLDHYLWRRTLCWQIAGHS